MNNRKLALASLLVVMVLALAPPSGWVFKNVLDFWGGKYRGSIERFFFNQSLITSQSPTPITDIAANFNKYSDAPENRLDPNAGWVPEFVEKHGEKPDVMGILLRGLSSGVYVPRPNVWGVSKTNKTRAQLMVVAAEQGERADPDNLFPTILKACALRVLNRRQESHDALMHAAEKTRYSSYAFVEAKQMVAAMQAEYGFRGHSAQIAIHAGILFPHFSAINSYADLIVEDGTTEERVALTKVGLTMVRSSEVLLEHMMGAGLITRATGYRPLPPREMYRMAKVKRDALRSFQKRANAENIAVPDEHWRALSRVVNAKMNLDGITDYQSRPDPSFLSAAGSLLVMLLGLALLIRGLFPDREPRQSKHFPTLQAFGAQGIAPFFVLGIPLLGTMGTVSLMAMNSKDTWIVVAFGLMFLTGLIVARRKLRDFSCSVLFIVGMVAVVGGTMGTLRTDARDKAVVSSLEFEAKRVRDASGLGDL